MLVPVFHKALDRMLYLLPRVDKPIIIRERAANFTGSRFVIASETTLPCMQATKNCSPVLRITRVGIQPLK